MREALPAGELSDADLQGIARAEVSDRYHGLDRELAGDLALPARGEAERHDKPAKRACPFARPYSNTGRRPAARPRTGGCESEFLEYEDRNARRRTKFRANPLCEL